MSGKYQTDDSKAKPSPLPDPPTNPKLAPKSGRTSTKPNYVVRRPLKKEGTILPGQVFPWKDYEEQGPAKGPSDTVVDPDQDNERRQKATTPDDYHTLEYNYGKKLPKNRGIPIPMERPEENPPKTTSTKSDKHAYKVRWS